MYRYGGDVVGAFVQKPVQDAMHCVAHALFFDQTHDNPSAIQVFSFNFFVWGGREVSFRTSLFDAQLFCETNFV